MLNENGLDKIRELIDSKVPAGATSFVILDEDVLSLITNGWNDLPLHIREAILRLILQCTTPKCLAEATP